MGCPLPISTREVFVQGTQLLLPIAVAVLFWLLIIRPQSRRARELRNLQSSLEVGDAVMLTSGIHGTVVRTDEETLQVEIAEGVQIRVARGAVGTAQPKPGLDEARGEPHDELGTDPDGTR